MGESRDVAIQRYYETNACQFWNSDIDIFLYDIASDEVYLQKVSKRGGEGGREREKVREGEERERREGGRERKERERRDRINRRDILLYGIASEEMYLQKVSRG
jgi:hypothetical protein